MNNLLTMHNKNDLTTHKAEKANTTDLQALVIGEFGTGFVTDAMLSATGIKSSYAANFMQDNKKYKIIACVLRNNSGTWSIHQDAIHASLGVTSVTNDSDKITLNFDFTASKVGSFVCTPDETYINDGIVFGASVGTRNAQIYCRINKEIAGYIYFDGTSWNVSNTYGITSAVWSTDKLVITHSNLYQVAPNIYNADISPRGGIYLPQLNGFGLNTVDVEFFDYAGTKITTPNTNMKFYFRRTAFGTVRPQDLMQSGSNIWVYGVFEVA